MTPETLASWANNALYSSMVVFTLAMLAFVTHLSARAPRRAEQRAAARTDVLVGAGAAAAVEDLQREPAPDAGAGSAAYGPDSTRSRQWGSIGLTLTYLATILLVGSVLMHGIAVARPPWGNMFEFATAAVAAVGVAYSLLARRNRWEWLGAFIVTPILLVL
ncbi:cytochrome C biogenesis protein CcsB, partial [Intrasporangium chromatireducens Q5-1]